MSATFRALDKQRCVRAGESPNFWELGFQQGRAVIAECIHEETQTRSGDRCDGGNLGAVALGGGAGAGVTENDERLGGNWSEEEESATDDGERNVFLCVRHLVGVNCFQSMMVSFASSIKLYSILLS